MISFQRIAPHKPFLCWLVPLNKPLHSSSGPPTTISPSPSRRPSLLAEHIPSRHEPPLIAAPLGQTGYRR
ncbi:hypothetical protein Hdeb2414_s0627g00926461 [Helianthus debilis subsp. tardiflorus]